MAEQAAQPVAGHGRQLVDLGLRGAVADDEQGEPDGAGEIEVGEVGAVRERRVVEQQQAGEMDLRETGEGQDRIVGIGEARLPGHRTRAVRRSTAGRPRGAARRS